MISIYLCPHYFFQAPEELWWPATTITGANDATGVGWALGFLFFVFLCVFSYSLMIAIYLGPHYFFQAPEELWWPATTITGPNDASGVVWALGFLFFVFLRVFSC